MNYLEGAWAEGQRLLVRSVPTYADLAPWKQDVSDWENEIQPSVTKHISGVDGLRFLNPQYSTYSHTLGDSLNADHGQIRNRIVHQLDELLRLRGEQERKLH